MNGVGREQGKRLSGALPEGSDRLTSWSKLLFAATLLAALAELACAYPFLPERVFSAFAWNGSAGPTTSKLHFALGSAAFLVGVALLVLISVWLLYHFPARFLKVPHLDFWLAEERRETVLRLISGRIYLIAACKFLLVAFLGALVIYGNLTGRSTVNALILVVLVVVFYACKVLLGWDGYRRLQASWQSRPGAPDRNEERAPAQPMKVATHGTDPD